MPNRNDAYREVTQACLLKDGKRVDLLLKLTGTQKEPASILLGPITVCWNSFLVLQTNVKKEQSVGFITVMFVAVSSWILVFQFTYPDFISISKNINKGSN